MCIQNYSALLNIDIPRPYWRTFQEKTFKLTAPYGMVELAHNSLVVLLKDGVHLYVPDTHRQMFVVEKNFCPE